MPFTSENLQYFARTLRSYNSVNRIDDRRNYCESNFLEIKYLRFTSCIIHTFENAST